MLLGSALALDWRLFLILVAGVAVITFITDYMFIGTLSASVGYLVWCILTGRSGWDIAIMAATVALIFWKHRKNFARLVKGKELGIRASFFKKKYRVDKRTPEPLRILPAAKPPPLLGEASRFRANPLGPLTGGAGSAKPRLRVNAIRLAQRGDYWEK